MTGIVTVDAYGDKSLSEGLGEALPREGSTGLKRGADNGAGQS